MDFLKELFGEEALTFEQLSKKVSEKGLKLADLSTGNYVAKKKYTDDLESRDTQISELSCQIATRDNDLKTLKKQLEDAGNDTTVADLTEKLTKLQGDYKAAKTDYEEKLRQQARKFAVTNFANEQQFSSKAAKKTFISDMLAAELKFENDKIMGANDFLETYKKENADSFVVEKPAEPETPPAPGKPTFVQPTPPSNPAGSENPFDSFFNFNGVR